MDPGSFLVFFRQADVHNYAEPYDLSLNNMLCLHKASDPMVIHYNVQNLYMLQKERQVYHITLKRTSVYQN